MDRKQIVKTVSGRSTAPARRLLSALGGRLPVLEPVLKNRIGLHGEAFENAVLEIFHQADELNIELPYARIERVGKESIWVIRQFEAEPEKGTDSTYTNPLEEAAASKTKPPLDVPLWTGDSPMQSTVPDTKASLSTPPKSKPITKRRARPPSAAPQPITGELRLILTADTVTLSEGPEEHWSSPVKWPDTQSFCFGSACLVDARRRLPVDWTAEQVRDFGDAIAHATFGDDPPPLEIFQAARRLVIEAGDGVPDLPWEYLRLHDRFLAQLRLSIVRHINAQGEARPLKASEPDPIAFAAANPLSETDFDVSHHVDKIFASISVDRRTRLHCNADTLRMLAEDEKIQGFHFLGHGHLRHIAVEGEPNKVAAGELAGWLSVPSKLKFVFLGACHSGAMLPRDEQGTTGVAATIAQTTGVPVVGMQLSVSQHYSTEFAAAFYKHFEASGWDIEEAVFRTRRATHNTTLFGVPVLFADTKQASVPVLDEAVEVPLIVQQRVEQISANDAIAWLEEHGAAKGLIAQFKDAGAVPKPNLDDPIQAIREFARTVADSEAQEDSWIEESRRALVPQPGDFHTLNVEIEGERTLEQDWSVVDENGRVARALAQFAFAPSLIQRIVGELYAGRHILLTGGYGQNDPRPGRRERPGRVARRGNRACRMEHLGRGGWLLATTATQWNDATGVSQWLRHRSHPAQLGTD